MAGSFHYFRALRDSWRDRLEVMKSAGLTVIDTYVEWATHNPEPGVYDWNGLADLEYFLELTKELGFYVILRPGPYICAERDNVSCLSYHLSRCCSQMITTRGSVTGKSTFFIISLLIHRVDCRTGSSRSIPELKCAPVT